MGKRKRMAGSERPFRIGVVAASSRFERETADRALERVKALYPDRSVVLEFHPACFKVSGHFAGEDSARAKAFLEIANDPSFDALWFARGGYGSCRIAEAVMAGVTPAARDKAYLGYSDAGSMLAGLYRLGFPHLFHGPMVQDIRREDGAAAFDRALAWLVGRDPDALEPSVKAARAPAAAFNITILSQLLGTPLEPDLTGHVLMLEEVGEAAYRMDRALFHITSQPAMRRVAGVRLGRVSDITPNDPDFGMTAEQITRDWCGRAGIPFLGAADIGHDADNRVVPFGPLT